MKLNKLKKYNKNVDTHGITLIALVVTIVILIILASVAINMTLGENGIFNKAKVANKAQVIAEVKEKIGTDILAAQIEATERNESLEKEQIEDIISNYGELQEDGDTIILKDIGYEVSLLDIYKGNVTSTGSYSELKAQNALLKQQLDDATKSQTESSKELSNLKTLLSQTTVTEDKILKDYTAYKDGKLITGTMESYVGQTQDATVTSDDTYTYLNIPNAGYYGTDSKLRTLNEEIPFKNSVTYKTVTVGNFSNIGVGTKKTSQTFDVSSYDGFENFTVYNFYYTISIYCHKGGDNDGTSHGISLSYNNSTGVLTISRSGTSGSYGASGTVYLTYAVLS